MDFDPDEINNRMRDFMSSTERYRQERGIAAASSRPPLVSSLESRVTATPSASVFPNNKNSPPRSGLPDPFTPGTPFFANITGVSPSRSYNISEAGVVRNRWTGSTLSVTGRGSDTSMGSSTQIWMNFSIDDEGNATGGSINHGSSFPGEIITTGSGDSITQTQLNVLIAQIVDDEPIQVLNSNVRIFDTPVASYYTVVAMPST